MPLKVVYTLIFIDLLAFGLLVPVLRPYTFKLGASPLQFGLLESIISLITFLTGPIAGSLSDSNGRKSILIVTLVVNILAHVLLGFSNTLIILAFARIILAISGKVPIVAKALISDIVPKEEQSKCYAKIGALSGAGLIVGPILSGYLYQITNDLKFISIGITSSCLLSLGLTTLIPSDKIEKKEFSLSKTLGDVANNFRSVNWVVFWDVFSLKFTAEILFMLFYSTFAIVLNGYGATQVSLGYAIAFHTVLLMAGSLSSNKIKDLFYKSDKESGKRNLHGFILLTIAYLGFYFSPSYWSYMSFFVPLSFARSYFDSAHMDMILLRASENEKGTLMGVYESMMPLAGFFAPIVSGISGEIWGPESARLIGIPPVLIVTGFSYLLLKKQSKIK